MAKPTLLSALVLLAITASGCEARSTDRGSAVVCTVVVDTPAKAENADKMVGTVRFRCESPGAETLTHKTRLEKKDGDQWHSAVSQTFTIKGQETIAPGLKYQARQVQLNCATGTYRTVVDYSRVSRGTTKADNLTSGTMRDPCTPFLRIR